MSEVIRTVDRRVASANGSQANSQPVYVGGNLFDAQVRVPGGTLLDIEVSGDKLVWFVGNDINGDPAAALANTYVAGIREGALWARFIVDSDGSGPRDFDVRFIIHKQGGQG